MAQQHLNFGTAPAGTDGDTLRTALGKVESNTTELYANVASNVAAISANTSSIGANATALGVLYGFKNKAINGNFDIWKRGTTLVIAAGGIGYIADRFNNQSFGGTSANVSQQAFLPGQTAVPNNPQFFIRHVVTSVAGAANGYRMQQKIEGVARLSGKTITVSFWGKADANRNMCLQTTQSFGTGGSPSANNEIVGTTCALTTAWQKFSVTVVVPSILGKTLGTNNNDAFVIQFWFDAGSNQNALTNNLGQQSGTFDIAQVQVEEGAFATTFDIRPIGIEWLLCSRYCNVFNMSAGVAFAVGVQYSSTNSFIMLNVITDMRASPSMTITGGGIGWTGDGTTNASNPVINTSNATFNQFALVFTISGATVGRAGYASAKTGGAVIILDAEL